MLPGVIIVIVCFAAFGALLISERLHPSQASKILVSFGAAQEGSLYSISNGSSPTSPVLVQPLAGEHGAILDEASDASNAYYLIMNSDGLSSNLYRENVAHPTASPVYLTNTPTLKFQLSYDVPSHMLAFVSGTILKQSDVEGNPGWSVTLFNTVNQTQKVIAIGTNPVVLPGGIMVLLRNHNYILVVNSVTGVETVLLPIAPGAPFAVSNDAQTLAVFNPTTKEIDYFDISNILSASYERSEVARLIPTAMTFSKGNLYLAGPAPTSPTAYEILEQGQTTPLTQFILPGKALVPQKVILP
jgi:hypothetical protein